MTEITENKRATLFYDGECRICLRTLYRVRPFLRRRNIREQALQTPGVQEELGLAPKELLQEIRYRDHQGQVHGGADAFFQIARLFWWTWPIYAVAAIPGAQYVARRGYRTIAARRHCLNGACEVPQRKVKPRPTTWCGAFLLPISAFPFFGILPPWIFMWLLAGLMFLGSKWLVWRTNPRTSTATLKQAVQFFLLWPGMDATPFLQRTKAIPTTNGEWTFVIGKMLAGITLLVGFVRCFIETKPLLAGWIGMVGIVCLLHFGLFHLVALFWRSRGVAVEPLMNNPVGATALTEFWGRRWNRAFNQLVYRFIFLPTLRPLTPAGAAVLTFLVSGIIHDLVISVPARGGYGLPTLYFVLQGIGMLIERSKLGRQFGFGHGVRGWIWTLLVTAGPAYWLFPPPFIETVILPMLNAIGITAPII